MGCNCVTPSGPSQPYDAGAVQVTYEYGGNPYPSRAMADAAAAANPGQGEVRVEITAR